MKTMDKISLILAFVVLLVLPVVMSETYASVNDLYGIMGDGTNRTGVLNTTFQVRSCAQSDCSDGEWSSVYTNATFSNISTISDNRYFQYISSFWTEDQNWTPMLFNVTVDYNSLWFNLLYNSSADLYYYNRTFDYAGNYSWDVSCSKSGFEGLSGSGEERVRVPLYNETSLGLTTGLVSVNYNEDVNVSVNVPAVDIDYNSSGYNLSDVWVQVVKPDESVENVSLGGECYDGETEIFTRTEVSCEISDGRGSDASLVGVRGWGTGELGVGDYQLLTTNYQLREGNGGAGVLSSESETVSVLSSVPNSENWEMDIEEKKKRGSSRVEPRNRLIRDYDNCNKGRYLKVSIDSDENARVAEWLMQSFDTRCPSGSVGSIPIPGVNIFPFDAENIINDKEKEVAVISRDKNVALMVTHKVLTELSNNEDNNYLSVSVDEGNVEGAPVALMVKHQSDKLGSNGHLGSVPGRGVSTIDSENIISDKEKEVAVISRDKNVALMVMQDVSTDCNDFNDNRYLNVEEEENKKGSNGMVKPNLLKPDYDNLNDNRYLNVSIDTIYCRARMAEWSTQSIETRYPSGCVGSIPTPGATENFRIDKCYTLTDIFSILVGSLGLGVRGGDRELLTPNYQLPTISEADKLPTPNSQLLTISEADKCYNYSWKLFADLDETEEVATLNQTSGELEWELPREWQEFDSDGEMFRIVLEDGSDLVVSPEHKVYVSNIKDVAVGGLGLGVVGKGDSQLPTPNSQLPTGNGEESVCLVVVSEFEKDDCFGLFVDSETKDKISENVDSSSSCEIMPERFVMIGELDNFIDFSRKGFFENRILSAEFIDNFLAVSIDDRSVIHFLNNSSAESNFIKGPFSALSNSSMCSGFIGSSSTGCQSIASQNSQSSSVTFLVCLNRSEMSCLTNLTNASLINLEANPNFNSLGSLMTISSMDNQESSDYINLSDFSLQPITKTYKKFNSGKSDIYFLNSNNEPVKINSITKESYDGKIYDVDVGNDVVLVRRVGNTSEAFGIGDLGFVGEGNGGLLTTDYSLLTGNGATAFWSGNSNGGTWNLSFDHLGELGNYVLTYFANLTNSFDVVRLVQSDFSVQNTSISISALSSANTTNVVSVDGLIRRMNGTNYWAIANNLFTIKLNDVLVSSDTSAWTNFTDGTGTDVNMSVGDLRLNLTAEGDWGSYEDDFSSSTKYLEDAESYDNVGYASDVKGDRIFDYNTMNENLGNITYKFSAVTEFYNASVSMTTITPPIVIGGGNDTIYYSFDGESWTLLNWTTSSGVTVGGVIPNINGEDEFYVRFGSDKTSGDNSVSAIEINYSNYNYSSSGSYVSGSIYLPDITYTTLKWDEVLNGGDIKLQLRESDDGISWGTWSANYTNSLNNDITAFSEDYLQFRAWLDATNLSISPIVQSVNVSYFNASTDSSGGYDYNITIPTNSLGSLPLAVEVVQNPTTGIVGSNITTMSVWAVTSVPYETAKNYTGVSNYSVSANWSRDDIDELVDGTFNITISNATMSDSYECAGVSQCLRSRTIPDDLAYGNYSVTILAHNESAYYRNGSVSFYDYLEEMNTTGSLSVANKTITDYSYGSEYPFNWNVTVNNTGGASIPDVYVYAPAHAGAIDSVVEVTPCSNIYPDASCNATMLITIKDTATPGSYYITWRANWTDNDGSIAGGDNYIQYSGMYVVVVGNATMELSSYEEDLTIQHESSGNFSFFVNATGSDNVLNVDISFVEGNITTGSSNLSDSWVTIHSSSPIGIIPAGSASQVNIGMDIPAQTAPGNYSGAINVSAESGGESLLNITVVVPTNGSWYLSPSANWTYNNSFSLNEEGEVGNWTIVNLGNINMTMDIDYSTSGSEDYTLYNNLFTEDNGDGTNPTSVNVTKGENSTFTVKQNGWDAEELIDIGVIISISNASATPAEFNIEDAWSIEEQAPEISGVWFLLDGVAGNIAERFKNVTIKFRATDDVALNVSGARINLSGPGGDTQIDADANTTYGEFELSDGKYIVLNYSGNYTPTTSGAYTVVASVFDNSGKSVSSGVFNFTSYGTTTVGLEQNYSSTTVSNVDLNNAAAVYVNYTINNSGLVTAYSPTLTWTADSEIEVDEYVFGDLSAGLTDSNVIRMNVSELTTAGIYNVTATMTWTNPDIGTDSDEVVFSITVEENSSIAHSPSMIITGVYSGGTNSSILQINNTGNTVLSLMSLDCYTGSLCTGLDVSFNDSNFQIGLNSSKIINVSLTAPSGFAAGDYYGTINISASGFSTTMDIQATVPETKSWSLSPSSINITRGSGLSGDLQEVTISNTGNVNMTWNLGTTNSTLFNPNVSSVQVDLGTEKDFMINYSAPEEDGYYDGIITVSNIDGAASPTQMNVSINMSVTALDINIISPTQSSPLEDVLVGDIISVLANATYGEMNITDNSTWVVTIGSSLCSGINSTYSSPTNQWNISCTAPDISDGTTHNLTVELTHDIYGIREDTELDAISYSDVTAPTFNITRNHIDINDNIDLEVNVTDNVAVENVTGVLTHPNSNVTNLTFTLSGGLYINNSFALDVAGEYSVNYSANDTSGNLNSSVDWFEVYDRYNWEVVLTDYASSAVSNVNISLMRPNTTTVLLTNLTNSEGEATFDVNRRFYDIDVVISGDEASVKNVNFTNLTESNISFNLYKMDGEFLDEVISLHKPFEGISINSTGLGSSAVVLVFNYSDYLIDNNAEWRIVKCENWNYTDRGCIGIWSVLGDYSLDRDAKQVTGNSVGFSSYFLAENKCGNGVCETTYAETTTSCSADCKDTTTGGTTIISSGGGGGGSSGLSSADLAKIEDIVKSFLNIGGVKLETTSIYKELFAGETVTVRIKLRNTLARESIISLKATDEVQPLVFFESNDIKLEANEVKDLIIKIIAPKFAELGEYNGNLVISSEEDEGSIPMTIKILAPEGKLLDVKIQPLTPTVKPGGILRLQTDLLNLGKTKRVDVQFDLQLIDLKSGEIVFRTEEAFAVETSISVVKNMTVPEYVPVGKYMIKAIAYYSNSELDGDMQASSIAYINVQYNFFVRKLFGIPIWMYLIGLLVIAASIGGYLFLRWREFQKKRFKSKVELNKLPQASSHSGFVGMVAETGIRTFIDMDKLQMHTLIAGATGGGKTIAAQSIIEEALVKKKSVIIFDPTAQWTGYLRKCEDAKMLKRYGYFGMKSSDAKSFDGTIQTIHDPYEIIDIKKYMNRPGEITIFNVSHLSPKEIDIVVASTIEQIFKTEPEESQELKTLIVYDEVHRLLPKFGGSGQGFVQLERGAREFRKWGIGLFLISQVLSDFIGEIKANIGTEVQMGTRYEGDLDRISMKYGDDVLKSVVKEPIGTGMVVNAEYNSGRPYFISFRPILHSTKRLSNEELTKYEKYFMEVEDLEYQASELKKLEVDVMDLELEIKLSKAKIKSGQFQMADMYLESLRPKVEEQWKKAGKTPVHLVRKRMSRSEVVEGIAKAKIERAKYIKKNPQGKVSFDQKILDIKKSVEEEKKKGKETSALEIKIKGLQDRLKPFKGNVPTKDSLGIEQEINTLKKEVSVFAGQVPVVGATKKVVKK